MEDIEYGKFITFFCIIAFYIVFLQNGLYRMKRYNGFVHKEINKHNMMKHIENSLLDGMERLGLIASRIRKNEGPTPQIEIDIILEELRNLYMVALQMESAPASVDPDGAAQKVAEEATAKKAAEEAAAKKAAEEAAAKKAAEEAAAKKAAEEAAGKKAAEEAAAKKAAEEAAAKKAAEEAAAKKAAEEAAAKKAAEEAVAKKAAEEAARKAKEEELKPIFAPEEPATPEPIVTPIIESIEGNPNDTLFETTPQEASAPAAKGNSLFSYLGEAKEEKPTVRTLADTLNHSGLSVEEKLETRVNGKKVEDLRTVININDKFSFMSELFHNNMKAYNDFILRLNGYTTRDQALAYVADVAAQYGWNSESLVVKNFYKVFDKKF